MSDHDRELLGRLLEAGREAPPRPTDFQSRAGWSRLQRALPAVVIAPQIDVPPAGIEAAAVGKAFGVGKFLGLASGVGWAGKAVVAGVLATTIGTVGVLATQQDARRDTPTREVGERAPEAVASQVPAVIEPAILPAVPPTIVRADDVDDSARVGEARSRAGRARAGTGTGMGSGTGQPAGARAAALETESAIVAAAHLAIAQKDLRGALALLDDHAARYPSGSMSEDREALRVVAQCRLGNTRAASRIREAFFRRWPDSMHAARVRAACSDAPAVP